LAQGVSIEGPNSRWGPGIGPRPSMKQVLSIAALLLFRPEAWKLRHDEEAPEGGSLRRNEESCSTNPCYLKDGWAPKPDFEKLKGSNNQDCCRPTCRRWDCRSGYKANPDYLDNVASNDRECCDRLCSTVQCNATHTVPDEKKDKLGASAEECCVPKCSEHTCFGSWATNASKLNQAGSSDEECCTPSCAAFACDSSKGFRYVADRHDAPQPVTNARDFCCEKTCGFYVDECGEKSGVDVSDKVKMATVVTDENFKDKCCEPTCSSVTCKTKHHHDPTYLDYLVSKVPVGSSCCIPTCAAYSCTEGWTSNPAVANFVSAGLTNEDCCLTTCALHKCGAGWFNSTDNGKLRKVSSSDSECCEPSCKEFQCRAGFARRPSAETTPATGPEACCESLMCADFRDNKEEAIYCNNVTDEAKCNKSYDVHELNQSTASNFSAAPCSWNAEVGLCRMDDAYTLTNCDPLK